ncbi:hypothetical protein C8R45DRAFT_1106329 [Mycena sanguinolenta]|nr:hypothetical protein C8R45DRAFT_1172264 [Mycena sanguinolenta]KAJ6466905.1 hypothetical protein C8R45DRAFT_1106329 [Mycena sanguinolenta]
MAPKTGECHAQDKDSRLECNCLQYQEIEQKNGRCSQCSHRRRHHELDESSSEAEDNSTPPNVLDLVLGAIPAGSQAAAKHKSNGKIVSTLFGQANREANKGMRPLAPNSKGGPASKKEKGKGKSEAPVQDNIFKALAIVVVPDGVVVENGTLLSMQTRVPDREAVQTLVGRGLAALNQNGFELDRTWTHNQLADYFFSVLPNVFGYFRNLEAEDPERPQWLLGIQSRSKLKVAPNPRPAGFDVEYNAGQSRTSFRNVHVVIVACRPIPAQTSAAWMDKEFLIFAEMENNDFGTASPGALSPEAGPSVPTRQRNKHLVSVSSDEEADTAFSKKIKTLKAHPTCRWSRAKPDEDEDASTTECIDLTEEASNSGPSTPGKAPPLPDPFSPEQPTILTMAAAPSTFVENPIHI